MFANRTTLSVESLDDRRNPSTFSFGVAMCSQPPEAETMTINTTQIGKQEDMTAETGTSTAKSPPPCRDENDTGCYSMITLECR